MKIEISGNKIKLVNTVAGDIEKVISFEKQNNQFVYSYSKDKHLDLLNNADCLHLSIRELENNKLVGHMILFGLSGGNNALELKRITITEKGKGYGREAIKLAKELCFEELSFHRLWLDVFKDNVRAIHLYESENFVKEGVLRENIKTDTGYRSLVVYSILENEYKA